MSMEPGAGRRDYDRSIDQSIAMYVQEVVAQTRHELRNEIAALTAAQTAATLQATQDYASVKQSIQIVTNEVAGLRRDLSEVLPLRDAVADLRHRDEIDHVRDETARQLLAEIKKQRSSTRAFMVALGGVFAAYVPVIALIIR